MIIRECTISDLQTSPNIIALLDEYADESSIEGLPSPKAKIDTYKRLECSGALHVIGAFKDLEVIGYITILSSIMPHYSVVVSVTESFFVAKQHRKTGAGHKLRLEAEKYAKNIGSPGLMISAPFGGILADILPLAGYTETNRVFFRRFDE